MRKFLLLICLVGCATTQTVKDVVVSVVKDCLDPITHAVTTEIGDDVSSIIVCDLSNAESLPQCVLDQLKALAVKRGWPAIDCALTEIQGKASANAAASGDTTENLRARRAQAVSQWRAGGGK